MPKTTTRKSENLHVRLPPGEKKEFRKAADRVKLDLTTWVRLALRRAAGLDIIVTTSDKK